tara:strand:- start:219 stop:584 length:366 start_codon:yes stop_codon:yes gene_type:complete
MSDEEDLIDMGENLDIKSPLSSEDKIYLSILKHELILYMDAFVESIERCNVDVTRRAKNLLFNLSVPEANNFIEMDIISKSDLKDKIIQTSLALEGLGKQRECGISYFTPLKDLRNFVNNH